MSGSKFSFPVDDSQFKKSSYSHPGGIITKCVEVAHTSHGVAMRNSNDPTKNTVFFTKDEFSAFLKGAVAGEFGV